MPKPYTIVATGRTTFHGPGDWDLDPVEQGQHDNEAEWVELCLLDPLDQPEYRTSQAVLRLTSEAATKLRDQLTTLLLTSPVARPHDHEEWMLDESATGGRYCRACGQSVADPASNEQSEGRMQGNEQTTHPV